MAIDTCYMCEAEATSREHVPPKCLFPKAREVGSNYRLNLITVPSCPVHNMGKSHDDEFLMVSLAGIIGNNSIGYMHKFTKVDRALRRTSFALLKKVFKNKPVKHVIDLGENKFLDVLWGTPDHARLFSCFDKISRGIFFHHYGQKFLGDIKVLLGFLRYHDESNVNLTRFLIDKAEMDLVAVERAAQNPDVYYYQVVPPDEHGIFLIKHCFYGGIAIYTALIPNADAMPKHLGFELMKLGMKTVFTLGDKTYEVN